MKKTITVLFTVIMALSGIAAAGADGIQWEESLETARTRAEEEGQNILVLITAPSWCGWCVRFEENVLSLPEVQESIMDNYIPLRLLDEVDGRRNPELVNFQFSSYPTVRIYDAQGGLVEDVYTQDPSSFMTSLEELVSETGIPQPQLENSYTISGSSSGKMVRIEPDMYEITVGTGSARPFRVTSRDDSFFYLFEEESEDYLAIPYDGGTAGICNYNGGNWTDWEKWLKVSPETIS